MNETDKIVLDKISSDLEFLYHRIHPTKFDLRDRVWDVWTQVMTIQSIVEDNSDAKP